MMSALLNSDSRLSDDPQPNPKRRKSSSNSLENGHSKQDQATLPHKASESAKPISTATETASNVSSSASEATQERANEASKVSLSSSMCGTTTKNQISNGTIDVGGGEDDDRGRSNSASGDSASKLANQSVRRNQFGEISDGHMSLHDWLEQWKKGKTRFTMKVPHRMLVKHINRLVEGKTRPSFFLPCCGKSLDMKWLVDRGYSVTGVEIAEMACRKFFEEHDMKFIVEDIGKGVEGKLFQGVDSAVRIFACDFFSVTSDLIGQFDCIWDRGSFAAMNPGDRARYCDVMSKLMKPEGRYLLDCFELEHSVFAGPPHNTEPEEIGRLFDCFDAEQIEHVDAMNDWTRSWGVKYFFQNDFILQHKTE